MAGKKAAKKRTTTAKTAATVINARRVGARALAQVILARGLKDEVWGWMEKMSAAAIQSEPRTQH